ncbi:hypothetical protein [Priestia aryabhattai]|uniref:hypothetical protein n=1 Tax=Priestia aryabhattai TaxID=412384 RepID=UPI002E1AA238|nr:hypothetical protein [Priestia aryabhattai]
MMNNSSKIITIEDVMDILAISSKKTIYTYFRQFVSSVFIGGNYLKQIRGG